MIAASAAARPTTGGRARALAALFASTLLIAACGSSDASSDGAGEDDTTVLTNEAPESTTTTEAPADEAPAASEDDADEMADEGADDMADDGAVASPAVRPEIVTAPLSAGPLTVTPTHCVVEGTELVSTDSSASSIAFAGERMFAATAAGILAFTVDTASGCTLSLDTEIGDAGVLHPDEFDSLSGTADGRLVAGNVFGMTVFDIEPGYSYECDGPNGRVSISPDGTQAVGVFATSPPELWTLNDTICTNQGELSFDQLGDIRFIAFDGADYLIGAKGLDDVTYGTRYNGTTEAWRVGTDEIGAPAWFGWVHGMAPCGAYTCIVDTNTFQLAVVGADGNLAAGFDFDEAIGLRGWLEPIIEGPDGGNYVLIGTTYDDEATDERTYFGEIIRLDVTG
ncbi:MAG: hypothetical protein ACRBI6_08210 [Acidimicrobiales bacterium]